MFRYLILLFVLLSSCSKEDLLTACDGDCISWMELPGYVDDNGYYHIKLDWEQQYLPRFSIDVYATPTRPELRYNKVPVVTAEFTSDRVWYFQGEQLNIVQGTEIYFRETEFPNVLYTKRIVGPFPEETQGDTINIKSTIFWEAGRYSKIDFIEEKFIIE